MIFGLIDFMPISICFTLERLRIMKLLIPGWERRAIFRREKYNLVNIWLQHMRYLLNYINIRELTHIGCSFIRSGRFVGRRKVEWAPVGFYDNEYCETASEPYSTRQRYEFISWNNPLYLHMHNHLCRGWRCRAS